MFQQETSQEPTSIPGRRNLIDTLFYGCVYLIIVPLVLVVTIYFLLVMNPGNIFQQRGLGAYILSAAGLFIINIRFQFILDQYTKGIHNIFWKRAVHVGLVVLIMSIVSLVIYFLNPGLFKEYYLIKVLAFGLAVSNLPALVKILWYDRRKENI